MQICLECGQAFDDDRCWVCAARTEDINETFALCLPVALAGITVANILALALYPPFASNWAVVFIIPGLSFIGAILLTLVIHRQLPRHATLVRVTLVLVTATFLMPAAYFFLNGIFDGNPAKEVPARVIGKDYSDGNGFTLVLSLSWNQKVIEKNVGVSREKYTSAEPGDSVRVVIHPGEFSQPWYSDVLLSGKGMRDSR
jgi:hypothetical protein